MKPKNDNDRFGINLRYLELPCDLITVDVLNELAQRCPNLTHLLLDFSHGAQLADFSGMIQIIQVEFISLSNLQFDKKILKFEITQTTRKAFFVT